MRMNATVLVLAAFTLLFSGASPSYSYSSAYNEDDSSYNEQAFDGNSISTNSQYAYSDYDDEYTYPGERSYYDNGSYYRNRYENRYYDSDDQDYYQTPSYYSRHRSHHHQGGGAYLGSYYSRLPAQISAPGENVIVVAPSVHAWGAYSPQGKLIRAGLVTAGSNYCPDIGRSCRTKVGTFRIFSLGSASCKSSRYPVGKGGAPMPYCMYFNRNQALHGSHELVEGNVSHGCVRMPVSDAEWLRFNFAHIGTKVIVKPY